MKTKTSNTAKRVITPQLREQKRTHDSEKRVLKSVSFNLESEGDLLAIAGNIKFGVWVKALLRAFTPVERTVLTAQQDEVLIPAQLVEAMIENGYFCLDEYLASKGQKIVDIQEVAPQAYFADIGQFDGIDEYNQDYS